MAVVQISKITVRSGRHSDLPDSLEEGEFGMATDTGEVFIGAPNLSKIQWRRPSVTNAQGAYPYSNIKILTEFDVFNNITGDVHYHGPLLTFDVPLGTTSPHTILSWDANESNAYIFDYSLVTAYTTTPQTYHYGRIGTIWLMQLPGTEQVTVRDDYTEVFGDNHPDPYPGASATEFSATIDSSTINLNMIIGNTSYLPLKLQISGRNWLIDHVPTAP